MRLPVVQSVHQPEERDLVRFFHRTEVHWLEHFAEPAQLEVGTAFINPGLTGVRGANCIMEAALPEDVSAAEAVEQVQAHFAAQGSRCGRWVMNPAAPEEQVRPLVEQLGGQGYRQQASDIMYLRHVPEVKVPEVEGLRIIPARASYRHARELAEAQAAECGTPPAAEAAMAHLDDPNWDALLALQGQRAVAKVGVLAIGEIGRIDDHFVVEGSRRQGIGRTLMTRAMEICARSLFRHVFLSVSPQNREAIRLYGQLGFEPIGQIVGYEAPSD